MGRLWDLVMKFVGEFGGYGDTSFHPVSVSPPPPRFSRVLMRQRGRRRKDDPETGEREGEGGCDGRID